MIILNGDFNSKNDWENMEIKSNSNLWDKNVLEFMQDFFLHQHIQYFTRKRGLDEPSILDLAFTRQKDDVDNIIYSPPVGTSDHVLLEYNFMVAYDVINEEENYKNMLNYKRGNYAELRKFFSDIDWKEELVGMAVNSQYSIICEYYKTGESKLIPLHKEKRKREHNWFNKEFEKAKEKRDSCIKGKSKVKQNRAEMLSGMKKYVKY